GSRRYIDGVREASSSSTAGPLSFAYSQEGTLGSRYKYDSGAYVGHFEGQFAEFRVWSDIRSPAEVVDAASAAEIDTAWEADLAGQWALSEGAGTALVDAVGAAADGVVMDGASAGASWLEECLLNDDDEDGYLVWEDCDDGDASVYPLGGDTYGDGIDSDCDGLDCEAASDGSVYMAVCPGAETWTSALSECSAAAYSSLATILSSSEHAFVEGLILAQAGAGGSEFWFGLNQRSLPESDWEFESGISWSYSNWYPGEPDDNGGADCGRLLSTHGYRWGDAPCTNSAGFICEFR
ncbi:MAG: lectin-like protein, partial [Myxococcota bacterium]|nr:lectin-like protein [Myxococcota bacterium]